MMDEQPDRLAYTTDSPSRGGSLDPPNLDAFFDALRQEAQAAYQESAARGYEEFLRRLSELQKSLSEALVNTQVALPRPAQPEEGVVLSRSEIDDFFPGPAEEGGVSQKSEPGHSDPPDTGSGEVVISPRHPIRDEKAVFPPPQQQERSAVRRHGDPSGIRDATSSPSEPKATIPARGGAGRGSAESCVSEHFSTSPSAAVKACPGDGRPPERHGPAVPPGPTGISRDDVLRAVAVKTGFPREMLEEYLNTGAKLEIAPPKLIEIFKEISKHIPKAPRLEHSRITELTDLAALVGFLVTSGTGIQADSDAALREAGKGRPEDSETARSRQERGSETEPSRSSRSVMREAVMERGEQGQSGSSACGEPSPESSVAPPVTPAESAGNASAPSGVVASLAREEDEEKEIDVVRHVLRAQVSTACGLGLGQLRGVARIDIVPDDGRVAEVLCELLHSEGIRAEITQNVPPGARGVIALNGLRAAGTWDAAARIQFQTFEAARALVHELGEESGFFVTVQDTGGDFGMSAGCEMAGWYSGLPGLARTLAAEYPRVGVKVLDVEREGRSAEVVARRIFRELIEGGPEVEIGLSADGTRLTQVMELTEPSSGGALLEDNAVVIVHGAGQGILTAPVLEMARRQRLRFVLLGSVIYQEESEDPLQAESDPDEVYKALAKLAQQRADSESPDALAQQFQSVLAQREVRRLIRELRDYGSQVCYFPVDSTDRVALETILAQARREWSELAAVLHSTSGSLQEAGNEAQFVQGWRASLAGIENLLSLTRRDPLKLIGLLSPSADIRMGAAQVEYAMVNEIINRLACAEAHDRGASCNLRSINWAFCDDGTLGTRAKEAFALRGIDLIPWRQTGRVLVDELMDPAGGDIQVAVGPGKALAKSCQASRFNAIAEVQVSKAGIPQLEDHQVQSTPAVPAVMVLEWFLRYARQVAGPHGLFRCRDFQQIQGIAIPGFENRRASFFLVMDSLTSFRNGGRSAIHLFDETGRLRYTAIIEQVKDEQALGLEAAPELELERTAWMGNRLYGPDALFHGPSFQVIHRVDGTSPCHGVLGRLLPPENAAWAKESFVFHPAMIDGVIQLASVWGLLTQKSAFLVTSIGEFVQAPHARYDQALRCVLEGLESSSEVLRLNAYLESDGGDTVAVMRQVTCKPLVSQCAAQ